MRRIRIVLATIMALSFMFPALASAQTGPLDAVCSDPFAANGSSVCQESNTQKNKTAADLNPLSGKGGILMRAAKLFAFITGVASIILIIIGGFKYVVSSGDSNSISSAKHTIIYALVGLAVALTAEAIVVFIIKALQ